MPQSRRLLLACVGIHRFLREFCVHDIIPLSLLSAGQFAEVFNVAGISDYSKRLGELGFRQGVRVQMVQPGSPCIVRLDNSKLCFRGEDASSILVRPGAAS